MALKTTLQNSVFSAISSTNHVYLLHCDKSSATVGIPNGSGTFGLICESSHPSPMFSSEALFQSALPRFAKVHVHDTLDGQNKCRDVFSSNHRPEMVCLA